MDSGQIAAIILAAGSSSRMSGVKKEFAELSGGGTALESSVRVFSSLAKNIVIAVPEDSESQAKNALPEELHESQNTKIIFVNGAQTRRASALNALRALLPHNPRYVLIHDGARPWVSAALAENLIAAAEKYGAVIPVVPLTETPKELGIKNVECGMRNEEKEAVFIERHLKRVNVSVAQTPQVFKFPEILHAHEKAALLDEDFTDDAEIWDKFCGQVAAIPGEPENRKITFPEDLN